ncbi:MAG: CPBP family intramembrane glutamic endopeptidase [Rhodothermaceae bacterium]
MKGKYFRIAELVLLFIIAPIIISYHRVELKSFIIPIILVLAIYCLITLLKDKNFNRKRFLLGKGEKGSFKIILYRFLAGSAILLIFMFFLIPELLFDFPLNYTSLWIAVLFIYPLLSVYPQEIIFRTYIFHRYSDLFSNRQTFLIFNAVLFGFAHIVYGNWIAVVLSSIGGYFFATTYDSTESTIITAIEHGFWGDLIFTAGLGIYFYSGAIS